MKKSMFACIVLIYTILDHDGVTAWKPKMIPAVEELLIQEGDELRLSCQGEGRLQFSTQQYQPRLKVEQSDFTGSFNEGSNTYTFIRPKTIKGDTGWYACAEENILIYNDEKTINHSREEISWIYVYVNSSRPFIFHETEVRVIGGWIGEPIVIPCRTTSPNLPVILFRKFDEIWKREEAGYDPKIGFIMNGVRVGRGFHDYRCEISGADDMNASDRNMYSLYFQKKVPLNPIIEKDTIDLHVIQGKELILTCTVKVPRGAKILLSWTVPNSVLERLHHPEVSTQLLYKITDAPPVDDWKVKLTVKNVSKTDDGKYYCVGIDEYGDTIKSPVQIKVFDGSNVCIKFKHMVQETYDLHLEAFDIYSDSSDAFINVSMKSERSISEYEDGSAEWDITIDTLPQIDELYWCTPDGIRINHTGEHSKYEYWRRRTYHSFIILNLVIEDSGNYTIHVSTSFNKTSITLPLTVLKRKPIVSIGYIDPYFAAGQSAEVECFTDSKYLPNVTWSYKEYPDFLTEENFVYSSPLNIPKEKIENFNDGSEFIVHSRLNITINMTGELVCSGCDANGCAEATKQIFVSNVAGRFRVVGPDTVTEGDDVNLTCSATLYDFIGIMTWAKSGISSEIFISKETHVQRKTQKKFTLQSVLRIRNVHIYDSGIYECRAINKNHTRETILHELIVTEALPPRFTGLSKNNSEILLDLRTDKTKTLLLECLADGRPTPKVTWWKNDEILIEGNRHKLSQNNFVLDIENVTESDGGRYTCHATNRIGEVRKHTNIKIIASETYVAIWPIASIAVVSFLIVVTWMSYRKRHEMASRRRFMEATLQRFNAGALDCLDPELNMAEQAERLPYNKKWEFPRELLKLGKELGSGAFGIVKMAQAKSICKSEAVTTVAVKIVRSTANLNHMTALQRELKILAYLGKHLNVVNLLGACTKHVSYGQLFVIVEFCRFGNLRDYLVRRRSDFVNQAANVGEDIDAASGDGEDFDTANDNSVSKVSCDMSTPSAVFRRSTGSTDRSTGVDDRVPAQDLLEEAGRTNYQGDFTDENLEPISTRDLLCWAWQVARGMKFLGLRRVLHGDLAARNILLADHGVVKICDFGLAKTLFTDDNYQQKGNDPLPYKWMAIESLKDRVFSVHSDVWSYGVVLWEFYSLAKTPYSGIRPETLHAKLTEGFRMARPEHATLGIYQIMLHCWNAVPFQRPSFDKLIENIGHLLEDSVKTQYFDLNAPYVRITADALKNGEPDFLTMSTSEVILKPNEQSLA